MWAVSLLLVDAVCERNQQPDRLWSIHCIVGYSNNNNKHHLHHCYGHSALTLQGRQQLDFPVLSSFFLFLETNTQRTLDLSRPELFHLVLESIEPRSNCNVAAAAATTRLGFTVSIHVRDRCLMSENTQALDKATLSLSCSCSCRCTTTSVSEIPELDVFGKDPQECNSRICQFHPAISRASIVATVYFRH